MESGDGASREAATAPPEAIGSATPPALAASEPAPQRSPAAAAPAPAAAAADDPAVEPAAGPDEEPERNGTTAAPALPATSPTSPVIADRAPVRDLPPVAAPEEEDAAEAPPAAQVEQPSRGIGPLAPVRAARLFAGPGQYPPEAFAAYGVVAFRARASSADRDRHLMLCEAYVAALPRTAELNLPDAEQMVTVWPIDDSKMADALNEYAPPNLCETAVAHYGLPTALQAIRDAGDDRIGRTRRGPFLLAWSPSLAKGSENALVLFADLSDVTTPEQANAFFVTWRDDIEGNPEYWEDGWNVERLRVGIRLWVDRFGSQIFSILGV